MPLFLHDLTFGAPLWLWGLLALPLLVGLFIWSEVRADRRLRQLIRAARLRTQLTGAASAGRRRWRYGLLLAGLAGLIVSFALPRLGYEQQPVHLQGLDLIFIMDVSKSMLATDVLPNRLTRAKLAVQDGVRLLTGDRVGMVAFAGNAFLQAPLTIDYDAILNAAAELDTDLIPRGGTNIGGAIELALDAFGKAEAANRAIILMSDGEPTSDGEQADGIKAARAAAAAGVKIFTIGFGTAEGSLIPLNDKAGEFVREEDGTLVRTRLNEANLVELAKTTGGFYTPFTNGEATMRAVVAGGLGKMKTGELDARESRKPIERYQWPLGAALLFLAASALIGERRKTRAPAAVGGVSPDARAVPVPRRAPGGPSAAAAPAMVVVATLLLFLFHPVAAVDSRADDPTPAASPTTTTIRGSDDAFELYNNGKYKEAYEAFKRMAEKDPKGAGLHFDAGTSAYKGKQYDEALEAFGNALASNDPNLQAQSLYNFGNTLFRRGEEQKTRETKVANWRDAIKQYDAALDFLKTHKDEALAANTAYNRDVVQKHLDEELKEPPKQDQQKPDPKKDQKPDKKKDQKQQGKPDPQKGDQKQQDPQKGDGDQNQKDQQQQQQGGGGQSKNDPSGKGSEGKPDPQQSQSDPSKGQGKNNPTPQPDSQGKPDGQGGDQGEQKPPLGGQKPDPSKGENGQTGDSQPPGEPAGEKPDPGSLPDQDKPRPRGELKAQPGKPDEGKEKEKAEDKQGEKEKEGEELAQAEPGKMTAGQARALLDSLKNEDDRVNLVDRNRRNREEVVTKDW